jgi:GGDEF domain-containing protein
MSIDAPRVVSIALPDSSHRDPRAFVASLASELAAALPGIGVHYHHAEHGIEVGADDGGRNQLSYRLRHKGVFLGEVTLRLRNRFSGADIDQVESILARALPALADLLQLLSSDASSEIDGETALQTRTALLRHLARVPAAARKTLLIIRIDDAGDENTRRRVALQLSAVLGDPDRAYRISDRAFAVALYDADGPSAQFLAERIRLMVAAMPAALPAPSVTVAIAEFSAANAPERALARCETELDQRAGLGNRVVTL